MGANNPEIIRMIDDINSNSHSGKIDVIGWIDNDDKKHNTFYWDIPIIGSPDILNNSKYSDCYVFNNITRNGIARRETTKQLMQYNLPFISLVHPKVNTRYVEIGEGVCIQEGVILQAGVCVGNHAYIASSTVIGHEARVDKYVFISASCVVAGFTHIQEASTLWPCASIAPKLVVGEGAVVGNSAVVFKNILPKTSVAGNPARTIFRNND